jgi:O-antigen/teichoic acid export membrane protein
MILLFLYSVLLARILDVREYGMYEYTLAWMVILVVPAMLGQEKLLTRNLPAYSTLSDWQSMRGSLFWSLRTVAFVSVGISVVAALFAFYAVGWQFSYQSIIFWIGCLYIPLTALTMLCQGALSGLDRVIYGQLPLLFFRPLISIVLVVSVVALNGSSFTALAAITLYIIATGLALSIGVWLLARNIPIKIRAIAPRYASSLWIREGLPLMFISVIIITNGRLGTLLLGLLHSAESAGIYAVLQKGNDLIAFVLVAANAALAPVFARLYASQHIAQLQAIAVKSARWITLATVPGVVGFVLFGDYFLLLFGENFTSGHAGLIILSIGQLVNVAAGSVGLLLMMTDYGREAAIGSFIALFCNAILCWLLIPGLGVTGAAIAGTTSNIIWNIVLLLFVHYFLKIRPTIFG